MINSQAFFTGLKSLKGARSPALPLAACFVALGALLKDGGFNIQQSAASSFFHADIRLAFSLEILVSP